MDVLLTKKAAKELDKLPDPLARKIASELQKLGKAPFPANSKKLKGDNNYRLRIGVYRAIYWIDKREKTVVVLRVADRKTVYRNF